MTNVLLPPYSRWADIKINDKLISINSRSGFRSTVADFDQKNEFLSIDASDEEIGKHLREALNLSRFVHPIEDTELSLYLKNPDRYKEWLQNTIDTFGYKNKTQLLKRMMMVSLTQKDNEILVEPSHQRAIDAWDSTGITEADNVIISENCTDEELGAAARLALSRCTSKFIKK